MTESEIRDALGYDGPVPRAVTAALAMVPVPVTAEEAAQVVMAALRAAGQLGRSLVPPAPDMRRRYR